MAGDWIKLEHATIDKPEVARIAELLNVAPEYALGLVVRFWVWFDQNSRHGLVTPCHAKSVEAVMRCPGFMSVMQDVGWLSMDEKTHTLSIPNPDRHNTSPAKSRALANDRQRKHRNAPVTLPSRISHAAALPEKRREEKFKNDVDVKGTVGVEPVASGQKPFDIQKLRTAIKPMYTAPQMSREDQLEAVRLNALKVGGKA